MFEKIKQWDIQLFLYLNGRHNSFFDVVMFWASDKLFWLPFYIVLLIVIIRRFKKRSVLVLLHVAALVAASDQFSELFKNTVKRLRPSHEIAIKNEIHLSVAGAGGPYGFVSSHAANAFALLVLLWLILPASFRPLKYILLFWAVLVAYSRIYNGVHYPGDVLCGALLGSFLGWLFSRLYFYLDKKFFITKYQNEMPH